MFILTELYYVFRTAGKTFLSSIINKRELYEAKQAHSILTFYFLQRRQPTQI